MRMGLSKDISFNLNARGEMALAIAMAGRRFSGLYMVLLITSSCEV